MISSFVPLLSFFFSGVTVPSMANCATKKVVPTETSMPPACPRSKIRNPNSGRCVKKTGKIGKAIRRSSRKSGRAKNTRTRKSGRAKNIRTRAATRVKVKAGDRKFFRTRYGDYDAYVARRRSGKLVWVHSANKSKTRKIGR